MFLNIHLKSFIKWKIIILFLVIAIFVIVNFLMINLIDKVKNGEKVKEKIDLTFSSYYTQYDMTVISNKNINTYSVKEWHKEGEITKLEYLDYMKNTVTITLQNNMCTISNNGNTSKLVVQNMYGNKNIASLSTWGYIYNLVGKTCDCSKEQYIKDGETTIIINLKNEGLCECSKFSKELGVSCLKVIFIDNNPKNYIIYDKNKNEYISIVYNVYEKI